MKETNNRIFALEDMMANIRLFKTIDGVTELPASTVLLEREIQTLIERNMPTLFGVTFLKSEYATSNGGRIDSLGIDENRCPVIFEYKRSLNENVINQGLFYLDWLLDHKADFEKLVSKSTPEAKDIVLDWSMPRLICIAGDFTRYDEHAVRQINRNIDLVRYRKFGGDLLMVELVNSTAADPLPVEPPATGTGGSARTMKIEKTLEDRIAAMEEPVRNLLYSLQDFIRSLGDDIEERRLTGYFAYRKTLNIACLDFSRAKVFVYLRLDPTKIELEPGFSRDVRKIGHWGTGDLELSVRTEADFAKAKSLIQRAYEIN